MIVFRIARRNGYALTVFEFRGRVDIYQRFDFGRTHAVYRAVRDGDGKRNGFRIDRYIDKSNGIRSQYDVGGIRICKLYNVLAYDGVDGQAVSPGFLARRAIAVTRRSEYGGPVLTEIFIGITYSVYNVAVFE